MRVCFGLTIKTLGRPLSVTAHLKENIVEVKAADNCLAHALITAIAKVDNVSKYKSYRDGWKIRHVVQNLLDTTGIDLNNCAGYLEFTRFQVQIQEYSQDIGESSFKL